MDTNAAALPRLVDFDTACGALGVAKRTAEVLIKRGDYPAPFFIGRRRFYRPEDLANWIRDKAAAAARAA
jgi:hypothetical protein